VSRAAYRSRQFFGALRPHVDSQLRDEAFALMSSSEQQLYRSMTPRDQQHCLVVYARLREMHTEDRDLLVAAMLHDCGKGSITLWHRVVFVLLDATAPSLLRRAVAHRPESALYRCVHHAELGAQLAETAGSSPAVVELIRGERASDQLVALRAADDES